MSVQRPFNFPDALPIDRETALEGIPGGCASNRVSHRDVVCPDRFATTCLAIVRFVAAAYATGEAGCWEAALQHADEATDLEHGPLLVARVAALLRTIRRGGTHELAWLPASCNRLTIDEAHLIRLIESARRDDQRGMAMAVAALVDSDHQLCAMRAAQLISDLSLEPSLAKLRGTVKTSTTGGSLPRLVDCLGCPASPLVTSAQNGRR